MAITVNLIVTVAVIALALYFMFRYFPIVFDTVFGLISKIPGGKILMLLLKGILWILFIPIWILLLPIRLLGSMFGLGKGLSFPSLNFSGFRRTPKADTPQGMRDAAAKVVQEEQVVEQSEQVEAQEEQAAARVESEEEKEIVEDVRDYKEDHAVLKRLTAGQGSREEIVDVYDSFKSQAGEAEKREERYNKFLRITEDELQQVERDLITLQEMKKDVQSIKKDVAKNVTAEKALVLRTENSVEDMLNQLRDVKQQLLNLLKERKRMIGEALDNIRKIYDDIDKILKKEVNLSSLKDAEKLHEDIGKRLVDNYNLMVEVRRSIAKREQLSAVCQRLENAIRQAELSAARAA